MIKISQMIIEFNGGDIGVCYRAKEGLGELSFQSLKQKQKIGTKVKSEDTVFPVRLIFKNTESIDVVIRALKAIKETMNTKEGKSKC